MLEHLPEGSHWSGFAIGRMEMPMVAQAMLLGGNLRVGLEDNLYLSRGVLASNADLVRRAKEVVESLGGRLASTAEARDRLAFPDRARPFTGRERGLVVRNRGCLVSYEAISFGS